MTSATVNVRLGAAGLAVATAAAFSPVIAQADSFAMTPSLVPSSAVLTWGYDQLDSALLAQISSAAADSPTAAVEVDPTAGPVVTLIQYLLDGIATGIATIIRGTVVIGATITYVSLAFTGGVLTTIGNILPGPLGEVATYFGTATTDVANDIAQRFRVGPYSTASA